MEKAEIQALIREAFAAQKFAYVPDVYKRQILYLPILQNKGECFHVYPS